MSMKNIYIKTYAEECKAKAKTEVYGEINL